MLKLFIKLIIVIGIAAALYFIITGKNLGDWLQGQAPTAVNTASNVATSSIGTQIVDFFHKLGL